MLITVVLLFTSIFRPYQVAFDQSSVYKEGWNTINLILEAMFLIDMLVVFNTAYCESEFLLIKDRKSIATNYLKDQFTIDVTALVPVDYILMLTNPSWNPNKVMLVRLYKMVRITRLFKVYNKVTDLSKQSSIREVLNIDLVVMRLGFFLLLFFLLCHFTACLWAIIAYIHRQDIDSFNANNLSTWLDDYDMYSKEESFQLYIISFYWTITTITTVGYGDITATNLEERVFCSAVMVLGVISFSFANGSLSSILSSYDNKKLVYMEKVESLDKLQKKYKLPPSIYLQVKQNIGYEFRNNNDDEKELI